jgi:DNA-nicking Smr family endonuclease
MDDFIRKQLKSLRKTLREKPKNPPARPLPPVEQDDLALFRAAVKDVQPLKDAHFPHPQRPLSPWPRLLLADEARVMADAMTDLWPWDELESGEELLFMRPGVQHESLRKLRRGEWVVQSELDLHGHTSEEARLMVAQFLIACRKHNLRCVRIIHGKGLGSRNREPVLKLKLKNWLVQRDEVLAFCQARPVDGGGGAALVLLKGRHSN